jgi:two-component system response regulator HydG
VKPTAKIEPMDLTQLNLQTVLDFRPDRGIIRLHEQRVVILSAAAMGLLGRELIDTFGLETAYDRRQP